MFRLGKLLFGLAVAGVTAATVYSYLDESSKAAEDDLTRISTTSMRTAATRKKKRIPQRDS